MFIFGTLSLIPLAIIIFGAYHVWLTITLGLGKMLNHWHEAQIQKIAFVVIGLTILAMVAPLLIPTSLGIKEFVGVMYLVYGGTTLVHIYNWYQKRKSNNVEPKKDDKNSK